MRVLFGIDSSESTRLAIDFLIKHKQLLGLEPQLTCVMVEAPSSLRAVGALGADPGLLAIPPIAPNTIAEPVLQRLRNAGLNPSLELREGEPGLEIAQLAQDGGYDLIVLGLRQHGLLKRAVLGTTSTRVLSHCEVPVLIAR